MTQLRVFANRKEWLEGRRNYIGGSDAPVVLGVSSWSTPLALWSEKVGMAEIDTSMSENQKWGIRLESVIREAYVEETGREVTTDPPFSFRVSERFPNASASLDGIVHCPKRGPGVLQIKTGGSYSKEHWREEPPLIYQVQVQHEIAASGFSWGSFGVLIGGNDFFHIDVERNDAFIDAMEIEERAFWRKVEEGVPPPPSGAAVDGQVLARLYGVSSGKTLTFDDDARMLHEALVSAKERVKDAQKTADLAKQQLLAIMGDAEFGVLPDGSGYKRSERFRDAYTVQATSFTELRYVKRKGK